MPALEAATKAPAVKLPTVKGGTFDLAEARKLGPVALAFFKVSCPVCQMTFPYLERLYKANGSGLLLVGVSQDPKPETEAFMKEYGVTFPVALEDTARYGVSNAYGLTNVPTIFLVGQDGTIELSSVGWSKQDLEALNARMAKAAGKPVQPAFKPGEDVPEFKAG